MLGSDQEPEAGRPGSLSQVLTAGDRAGLGSALPASRGGDFHSYFPVFQFEKHMPSKIQDFHKMAKETSHMISSS